MSTSSYRRLTRFAAFAVAHLALVLALLVGGVLAAQAGLVLLVASIPLLFAWGSFQTDVALNPRLDEAERARWRIAMWLLPWTIALYWHVHVRGASPDVS